MSSTTPAPNVTSFLNALPERQYQCVVAAAVAQMPLADLVCCPPSLPPLTPSSVVSSVLPPLSPRTLSLQPPSPPRVEILTAEALCELRKRDGDNVSVADAADTVMLAEQNSEMVIDLTVEDDDDDDEVAKDIIDLVSDSEDSATQEYCCDDDDGISVASSEWDLDDMEASGVLDYLSEASDNTLFVPKSDSSDNDSTSNYEQGSDISISDTSVDTVVDIEPKMSFFKDMLMGWPGSGPCCEYGAWAGYNEPTNELQHYDDRCPRCTLVVCTCEPHLQKCLFCAHAAVQKTNS